MATHADGKGHRKSRVLEELLSGATAKPRVISHSANLGCSSLETNWPLHVLGDPLLVESLTGITAETFCLQTTNQFTAKLQQNVSIMLHELTKLPNAV